jgi:RimJ/RimL family protein N-acetyltransferase
MSSTTPQQPDNEAPVINILGENVALGPTTRNQVPTLHRWVNDFQVSILSGDPLQPTTLESLQAEYDRTFGKEAQRQNATGFSIYERASMRLIGYTELRHIDHRNRTATFGIMIGEKDCWHKGYGTEATRLMLDYGFNVLNLHNIDLNTHSYNEAAQKAYTRAGFRVIGRRRQACRWGDRIYDEVLMDCLSTEFERPHPPAIEHPQ